MTAEIAKGDAESQFEEYRGVQDPLFESDYYRLIRQHKSGSQLDNEER